MANYNSSCLSSLIAQAGTTILSNSEALTPVTNKLDNFSITINFTSSDEYDIDVYSNYKFQREETENGEE